MASPETRRHDAATPVDMDTRARPLSAPKSQYKDKAQLGNSRPSTRRRSSRITKSAAQKGHTDQTGNRQREKHATLRYSSHRILQRETANPIRETSTSAQQAKTRKRPREEDKGLPSDQPPQAVKRACLPADKANRPDGPRTLNSKQSYIGHWARESTWPKEYFEDDKMRHLLARKGSASSLSRKRSNSSLDSAGDDKPREEKSAPYRNPSYPTFLSEGVANYKSYLEDHELGISDASEELLKTLIDGKQKPPNDTLFRDDVFRNHLRKVTGKNESRVIQDLSPLLVPSAEALATLGASDLEGVVESVNEGWNNCFPITKTRPQPDSAFGYRTSVFSDHQLDRLRPTLGDPSFSSFFKATFYMLFPFLTKEVKTGSMGLRIADNQNLHSMTIAVRAVVELFKLVGREKELHREVIAFAVSHDDESVRIYAHYPIIDGDNVTIWRHTVSKFYLDAETKWRSYTFVRNVFDVYSPKLLERICSAIDSIPPDWTFPKPSEAQSSESQQLPDESAPDSGSSGPIQQLEHQRSNEEPGISNNLPGPQQITPNASIQSQPKVPQSKEPKKKSGNN